MLAQEWVSCMLLVFRHIIPPPGETSTPANTDTVASPFISNLQSNPPSAHNSPLSRSNLRSACHLILAKERVFSEELKLPEGVEVISATPAAGNMVNDSDSEIR